jgi:hypothetical protein
MDHHPIAIDIGDFEIESFLKSQTAGVDGGKIGIVLEGFNLVQEFTDFFNTQDGRKSSFGLGSEDSEDVPVSLKDMLEKEAYAAIANPHGIGGPLIDVFPLKEIILKFLFADGIRVFTIELSEHADGAGIGLLGAFPFTIELKSLDRFVIPIGHHDTSPFFIKRFAPSHWEGL